MKRSARVTATIIKFTKFSMEKISMSCCDFVCFKAILNASQVDQHSFIGLTESKRKRVHSTLWNKNYAISKERTIEPIDLIAADRELCWLSVISNYFDTNLNLDEFNSSMPFICNKLFTFHNGIRMDRIESFPQSLLFMHTHIQ